MNGTTEVPGSLFDLIRGEDVTVVFAMDNGITWSVNGRDVTVEGVRDIDFGVKYGEQAEGNIPVSVITNVTGEKFYTGLSLSYDGEFGFQAVLTLNMDQKMPDCMQVCITIMNRRVRWNLSARRRSQRTAA